MLSRNIFTPFAFTILFAQSLLTGCDFGGMGVPSSPPKVIARTGQVTRSTKSAPVADDTAAVQALLDAGGVVTLEARDYYFSAMLNVTRAGTTLQGHGNSTVLHWTPPKAGSAVGCKTDRAISVSCGLSNYKPTAITAPIAIGDTSIEVADVTGINAGDWLMVGNWGVLGTYTAVVDWVQVASINGTTISLVSPTRVAFDATQPFAPYASGAGYVRTLGIHDVTLQDFAVKIDAAPGAPNFPAVGSTGTLNLTIQRLTINDPAGNPLWTYYTKGTKLLDCVATGATVGTELASSVDTLVSGNQFNGVGVSLDLGQAFFSFDHNTLNNVANIGLYLVDNVHDGAISANTIGYVAAVSIQNTTGIYLSGSPNIQVTGNTLLGGAGNSIGIYASPGSAPPFSWPDTGDILTGNTIQGFVTPSIVR